MSVGGAFEPQYFQSSHDLIMLFRIVTHMHTISYKILEGALISVNKEGTERGRTVRAGGCVFFFPGQNEATYHKMSGVLPTFR